MIDMNIFEDNRFEGFPHINIRDGSKYSVSMFLFKNKFKGYMYRVVELLLVNVFKGTMYRVVWLS